jgi:hypothetical protein
VEELKTRDKEIEGLKGMTRDLLTDRIHELEDSFNIDTENIEKMGYGFEYADGAFTPTKEQHEASRAELDKLRKQLAAISSAPAIAKV